MTGHGVWACDAHIIMEQISSLKLMSMSILQASSYFTEQMQAEVSIDLNKFIGAFSIKTDKGYIHPPSWIPCGDDDESVNVLPTPPSPSSAATFNMTNYSKCRQAEAIRWIDLQEKRASIIPDTNPVTAEAYQKLRDAVRLQSRHPHRTNKKETGKQHVYPITRSSLHDFIAVQRASEKKKKSGKERKAPKKLTEPGDYLKRRQCNFVCHLAAVRILNLMHRINPQET
jgi:hypothetical protein